MGTLLISSLIVFPSLTAMRVCRRFKTTILVSALLSVGCFLTGITVSYLASVPTGACIVVTDILVFFVFAVIEKIRERI
jgi:zinc transport system permease protein